jgi:hypothetical protein
VIDFQNRLHAIGLFILSRRSDLDTRPGISLRIHHDVWVSPRTSYYNSWSAPAVVSDVLVGVGGNLVSIHRGGVLQHRHCGKPVPAGSDLL